MKKLFCLRARGKHLALASLAIFTALQVPLSVTAQSTNDDVTITIQTSTNVVEIEQPINLKIEVKNTGSNIVRILKPSVLHQFLRIGVFKGQRQIRSSAALPWGFSIIELAPGQSYTLDYDVLQMFHLSYLPSGSYTIRAEYDVSKTDFDFPFDKTIVSNEIIVEVKPWPAEKMDEFNDFVEALGGGGDEESAEVGMAFLTKYPQSIFADKVKLHTAFVLSQLKRYDEAIAILGEVTNSPNAPLWRKQRATRQLAETYYDKGDLTNAIATIATLPDPRAQSRADSWREELHPTEE
jgi:hypothetical protein